MLVIIPLGFPLPGDWPGQKLQGQKSFLYLEDADVEGKSQLAKELSKGPGGVVA